MEWYLKPKLVFEVEYDQFTGKRFRHVEATDVAKVLERFIAKFRKLFPRELCRELRLEMLANIREIFLQSSAPMKRVRWLLAGLFLSCARMIPVYRIPQINEELNLTVYNASSARQLEEAFEQDLKYSKQITYAKWNSRGIGARIYELFAFPVKEYL